MTTCLNCQGFNTVFQISVRSTDLYTSIIAVIIGNQFWNERKPVTLKKLKVSGIFFLYVVLVIPAAYADRCPTPDEIRERTILKDYDWTVDERTSLENILSVKKSIAVRIMKNGEFVSCRYTTERQLVRLDGLPAKEKCVITVSSGEWINTTTGESVCQEEDTMQCLFEMECQDDHP